MSLHGSTETNPLVYGKGSKWVENHDVGLFLLVFDTMFTHETINLTTCSTVFRVKAQGEGVERAFFQLHLTAL